jgi:hypothetical protein
VMTVGVEKYGLMILYRFVLQMSQLLTTFSAQ